MRIAEGGDGVVHEPCQIVEVFREALGDELLDFRTFGPLAILVAVSFISVPFSGWILAISSLLILAAAAVGCSQALIFSYRCLAYLENSSL